MRARVIILLLAAGAAGLASPVLSQLGLQLGTQLGSPLGAPLGQVGQIGQTAGEIILPPVRVIGRAGLDATRPVRSVAALARDRLARLADFARANRATIDLDEDRQPSRRGVVLMLDPDAAALETARRLGFMAHPVEGLDALGIGAAELAVPAGMSLADALKRLRTAMPGKEISADQIHFQSGGVGRGGASAPGGAQSVASPVGLIDGSVAPSVPVAQSRSFAASGAASASSPSDHGTAIAALLRDAGVTRIVTADVYGRDPAGGSALVIAQALGWMAAQKVPVVSISLVGPRNPLLERAVTQLAARGTTIVAAVGNDGPAAPPAYPASYASVLAVTGVDGRQRALIEAGRALHLDYAAPAADLKARDARGRDRPVRGTSFAVPFVAARAAAAVDGGRPVRAALDGEARDLGARGPDAVYGRGLLCGACARR